MAFPIQKKTPIQKIPTATKPVPMFSTARVPAALAPRSRGEKSPITPMRSVPVKTMSAAPAKVAVSAAGDRIAAKFDSSAIRNVTRNPGELVKAVKTTEAAAVANTRKMAQEAKATSRFEKAASVADRLSKAAAAGGKRAEATSLKRTANDNWQAAARAKAAAVGAAMAASKAKKVNGALSTALDYARAGDAVGANMAIQEARTEASTMAVASIAAVHEAIATSSQGPELDYRWMDRVDAATDRIDTAPDARTIASFQGLSGFAGSYGLQGLSAAIPDSPLPDGPETGGLTMNDVKSAAETAKAVFDFALGLKNQFGPKGVTRTLGPERDKALIAMYFTRWGVPPNVSTLAYMNSNLGEGKSVPMGSIDSLVKLINFLPPKLPEGTTNANSYTCPNGTTCDGKPVTGTPDQVVCGTDKRQYKCGPKGWAPQNSTCVCDPATSSGASGFGSTGLIIGALAVGAAIFALR